MKRTSLLRTIRRGGDIVSAGVSKMENSLLYVSHAIDALFDAFQDREGARRYTFKCALSKSNERRNSRAVHFEFRELILSTPANKCWRKPQTKTSDQPVMILFDAHVYTCCCVSDNFLHPEDSFGIHCWSQLVDGIHVPAQLKPKLPYGRFCAQAVYHL